MARATHIRCRARLKEMDILGKGEAQPRVRKWYSPEGDTHDMYMGMSRPVHRRWGGGVEGWGWETEARLR